MNTRKLANPVDMDSMMPGKMPRIPDAVLKRFGEEAKTWQQEMDKWYADMRVHLTRTVEMSETARAVIERLDDLTRRIEQLESA